MLKFVDDIIIFGLSFGVIVTQSFAQPITINKWDNLDRPGWTITTGGSGERPSIDSMTETPDPKGALIFFYKNGCNDSCGPGKAGYKLTNGVEELYYGHWFKYALNWDKHSVVNKIDYVFNSYGAHDHTGNNYLGVWSDRKLVFVNQITWGAKTRNYTSNTGHNPTVEWGRWYWLEVYIKMNTPGKEDGVVKVWLDDQLVMKHTNIPYRSSQESGAKFEKFYHNPIWGGVVGDRKEHEDFFWIDYTVLSTTPIGMSAPDDFTPPRPPQKPQIVD